MARDIKETLPDYQGKDSDLIRPEAIPGGSGAVTADYDEFHKDEHHHIVPLSTYYKIFGALMVLLVITVLAAEFDFGERISPSLAWMNIVVALVIAVTKAALIVMYFMHVKYSSRLVMITAVIAYFFVFIMFMLTYADYFTRGWMPQAGK